MAEIVRVRIDEARPYDLYGTAVGVQQEGCAEAKAELAKLAASVPTTQKQKKLKGAKKPAVAGVSVR
jgi:hypothetical protein